MSDTHTAGAVSAHARPWLDHYPVGVNWHQQLVAQSIPAMLDKALGLYANKPCTHFLGRTQTYAEIGQQIERVAAGLQRQGVVRGTRVGLFLPNCPTYIVYHYAALKLGAVIVNYNPLYTLDELSFQIKDSGTELMITLDLKVLFEKIEALIVSGTLRRAVVASFAALLPGPKSVLFKLFKGRDLAHPTASKVASQIILDATITENDGTYVPAVIDPLADLAVLQYTGGTTGAPKGAMLTHANITINVQQSAAWSAHRLTSGQERILAVLPFFHVFAMTGIMHFGISEGAEIIILPRFVLDDTVQLIAKMKPTVMPGVPTLFSAIMGHKAAKSLDLKSLKLCLSGGAPLPAEVKKGFESLTGATLVEAYGLSETAPGATCNPLDGRAKIGSIGQPLPGTSIAIRDPAAPDRELPLGQPGEICIAGPQVMLGYWNRSAETAEAFHAGFFRTGDVGYMDQDGFVFIVDRLKDMIICSGFKVYPRHIEEKLYQHPAVEEVTVIGVKDSYRGEVPKAYIKLKAGMLATELEVLKFLDGKVSKIEMPVSVEFREALPKTIIGKLSKKELRAEANAGR
jgi:long-chain acyl-CoA synthetase